MSDPLPLTFSPGDILTAVEMNQILIALNDVMTNIVNVEHNTNKGIASGYSALASDGFVPWSQLKPDIRNLPISFTIPGRPTSAGVFNLILAIPCKLPANLAGSVVYAGTHATSDSIFTLNKISGGVTTAAATITITTISQSSVTFSLQPDINCAIGDVLQLVAPVSIDATLSDICVTLLTQKI